VSKFYEDIVKKAVTKDKTRKKLTEKQKLFVEYLADPDNQEKPEDFAKSIGVSEKTLLQWKSNPVIVQSAFQLSITRLGAEIPKVLKMLLQKALESKDISACKLFFQQIEKITEIPETGISVDEVLQLINKVISQQEIDDDNSE